MSSRDKSSLEAPACPILHHLQWQKNPPQKLPMRIWRTIESTMSVVLVHQCSGVNVVGKKGGATMTVDVWAKIDFEYSLGHRVIPQKTYQMGLLPSPRPRHLTPRPLDSTPLPCPFPLPCPTSKLYDFTQSSLIIQPLSFLDRSRTPSTLIPLQWKPFMSPSL